MWAACPNMNSRLNEIQHTIFFYALNKGYSVIYGLNPQVKF